MPTWTKLLFVLVIAVFPPIILLQWLSGVFEPVIFLIGLSFDAFFFAIYMNFRKLVVTVSDEAVTVAFGFIKKRILIKEILSSTVTMAKLGVYSGNGIRVGGDGSLAFITNFGDAIRLTRIKGRTFVFSTNDPHRIIEVISSLKDS